MNENLKQIYLHVGLEKTGSSSIQHTLHNKKNQMHLRNYGYLYPTKLGINHSVPIFYAFCDKPEKHLNNILNNYSIEEIKLYVNRKLYFLEKEIKNTNASFLILSGEWISGLTSNNLAQLKNYLLTLTNPQVKISIIIYVRNPVQWAISKTQENIKDDKTKHFALVEAKKSVEYLYKKNIQKFIEIFEKKNIQLYKFEKAVKHPFGPVGHFLSAIDYDENQIKKFEFLNKNQSISQIAADIISYIHFKEPLLVNENLNKLRYWGDHFCLYKISGQKFDISIHEKEEIYEKSMADSFWLKNQFNVDYTKKPLFEKEKEDYYFNQKICKEIEEAYSKASPVIRQFIYRYFLEEIENYKMNNPSKKKFMKTLKRIDEAKKGNRYAIKKSLRILRDYFVIKNSGLFDKEYYLNKNEHTSRIKTNPIIHYLKIGASQGKNPSNDFNTEFYVKQNRDVHDSGINPLAHYVLYGKDEGREIQQNLTICDFIVLSQSIPLLKTAYDYLKWHPLLFMNKKYAEIILSNSKKRGRNESLNAFVYYHEAIKKNEQKMICDILLFEKNILTTITKLYYYNPQIKIIFLEKLRHNAESKIEKQFKATYSRALFLPVTFTQEMNICDKMKSDMFNQIFVFLGIDPWKPFL